MSEYPISGGAEAPRLISSVMPNSEMLQTPEVLQISGLAYRNLSRSDKAQLFNKSGAAIYSAVERDRLLMMSVYHRNENEPFQPNSSQDALHVDAEKGLFILSDGMGGHNGGAVASKLIVGAMKGVMQDVDRTSAESVKHALKAAINLADDSIRQAQAGRPELTGMGATLVAAQITNDNSLIILNAGDSAAGLYRGGKLEWLTTEQCHENLLYNGIHGAGRPDPNPYNPHTHSEYIRNHFDEYKEVKLQDGDRLVMVSDGILGDKEADRLPVEAWSEALATPDPNAAARNMIVASRKSDDTSVIIVDFRFISTEKKRAPSVEPDVPTPQEPKEEIIIQPIVVHAPKIEKTEQPEPKLVESSTATSKLKLHESVIVRQPALQKERAGTRAVRLVEASASGILAKWGLRGWRSDTVKKSAAVFADRVTNTYKSGEQWASSRKRKIGAFITDYALGLQTRTETVAQDESAYEKLLYHRDTIAQLAARNRFSIFNKDNVSRARNNYEHAFQTWVADLFSEPGAMQEMTTTELESFSLKLAIDEIEQRTQREAFYVRQSTRGKFLNWYANLSTPKKILVGAGAGAAVGAFGLLTGGAMVGTTMVAGGYKAWRAKTNRHSREWAKGEHSAEYRQGLETWFIHDKLQDGQLAFQQGSKNKQTYATDLAALIGTSNKELAKHDQLQARKATAIAVGSVVLGFGLGKLVTHSGDIKDYFKGGHHSKAATSQIKRSKAGTTPTTSRQTSNSTSSVTHSTITPKSSLPATQQQPAITTAPRPTIASNPSLPTVAPPAPSLPALPTEYVSAIRPGSGLLENLQGTGLNAQQSYEAMRRMQEAGLLDGQHIGGVTTKAGEVVMYLRGQGDGSIHYTNQAAAIIAAIKKS